MSCHQHYKDLCWWKILLTLITLLTSESSSDVQYEYSVADYVVVVAYIYIILLDNDGIKD